jgi:hypothetical protein
MQRTSCARLAVESLEPRENPSGSFPLETFDQTAPPALPSGWGTWSTDGTAVFQTAAGQGVGGSVGLVSSAGSLTAGLAWYPQQVSGDTGVGLSVNASSLVPSFVLARGTGLADPSSRSYIAAVVSRGLKVDLWEVTPGLIRVLATVTSPAAAYFNGWAQVSLVPTGDTARVQVVRPDTGQYLNAQGTWQSDPTNVLSSKVSLPSVMGSVGVGRPSLFAGAVQLDNFDVLPPVISVQQSFDTTAVGTAPTGWSGWASNSGGAFVASTDRAETSPNGFASTGTSVTAARGWSNTVLPADVDASAAVYLDSLIPAFVFARGSNLDTATPTYYAVTLTRGINAQLVRVANGVTTTLGSVKSTAYLSGVWVRARLIATGDHLQVILYRPDTKQWLSADGTWSGSPDFALDLHDGAITGGGRSGVGRAAGIAGTITFDDFAATQAGAVTAPVVSVNPVSGSSPFTGEVTFHATATGSPTRVEFRLNGVLRAASATAPADWTFDTTTVTNGTYTLTVRAIDAAGNFGSKDYTFSVNNPNADPLPLPTIPRHYSHIRIAELAYTGNPMGATEQQLLRDSVDLVIPNTQYLATIQQYAPDTPQLIYSNVSNLYQGLLTDWLSYADRTGASREAAFYHVTQATPFSGGSPSSQPVNWFWGVFQSSPSGVVTDVTSAARGGRNFNVNFGPAGQWTAIGYLEKFREMNVTLVSPAAAGWAGVWEYASAVDANGNPTAWTTLPLLADGTNGMRQTGTIAFDPPAGWPTATIGGSDRLFYVRLRVTAGTATQAPVLKTVFGRDYVGANGGTSGVMPAFDATADRNGDGYLNDAEYATRRPGMDARFVYESRLFYPYYGQMRFVTNPSSSAVRKWSADYHVRLLAKYPLADGVFIDNATGKLPFAGVSVLEPTGTYSTDSGSLIGAVWRAISPKWVLSNTAGGRTDADPVAANSAAVFEEFILRPLDASWSDVGDAAGVVAGRLAAPGNPYVVLDSYPAGGTALDSRTQLAALSYYYLLGDPNRTFLMFNGGYSPSSSWVYHWSPAAAVNVGKPTGAMRLFASGADPQNAALTYKVFARDYENALVLYKPLSYATGTGKGTLDDATATVHQLGGNYRVVNGDGTLGPVVTSVSLRNGEGVVLIKA